MPRIPSFHEFMVERLGDPRRPLRLLHNFFVRPLLAGSFVGFWRRWNPPFLYVCLFFVYRPLRLYLPRPAALFATFLVSGFVLHDIPFGNGIDILRGRPEVPKVTLLLGIFGLLALVTAALRIDLSPRPSWVRAAANLLLLAVGFGVQKAILALVSG
jgi:hypothetical protein